MTLHIRLLSVRLAMMQYALMHIARHEDHTVLIGADHAQTDLVQAIKMREPVEVIYHRPDFTQREYQQKHNRKTGAAKHRRQAKARRNRK